MRAQCNRALTCFDEQKMLSLLELCEEKIEVKIGLLAFAHRVTMTEHPESCFVLPSLLHGAVSVFDFFLI